MVCRNNLFSAPFFHILELFLNLAVLNLKEFDSLSGFDELVIPCLQLKPIVLPLHFFFDQHRCYLLFEGGNLLQQVLVELDAFVCLVKLHLTVQLRRACELQLCRQPVILYSEGCLLLLQKLHLFSDQAYLFG